MHIAPADNLYTFIYKNTRFILLTASAEKQRLNFQFKNKNKYLQFKYGSEQKQQQVPHNIISKVHFAYLCTKATPIPAAQTQTKAWAGIIIFLALKKNRLRTIETEILKKIKNSQP